MPDKGKNDDESKEKRGGRVAGCAKERMVVDDASGMNDGTSTFFVGRSYHRAAEREDQRGGAPHVEDARIGWA